MGALAALHRPVDPAGLAVFRMLFGTVLGVLVVRTWASGWIEDLYLAPAVHFTWVGFDWVRPLPGWGMYFLFVIMGMAALGLALGVRPRLCAGVFGLLFTWVELIDKAPYLNHYYLVSLLCVLLACIPTDGAFALRCRPSPVPWGAYLLLRSQLAIVYFFAGFAKLNPDWLFEGQPLATWLPAFAHWPVVGPWLATREAALALAWCGAVFDLTIWIWLAWRPTRRVAWLAAVGFHALVGLMFPIGLFSWVMAVATTLFFAPDWPRRWMRPFTGGARRAPVFLEVVAGVWLLLQVAVPLRFCLYPGSVLWTEEGFRFAWRVMLVEKTGQVEYRVSATDPPLEVLVFPRKTLAPLQYRQLVTQPDLILDYAHILADEYRARGHQGVQVRAEAFVALNGRPSQRLIDPDVDLAAWPRGWAPRPWILPLAED